MKYLAVSTMAIGLVAFCSAAQAACDVQTVKGTFAAQTSGSHGTGPFTPFVASSIRVFDGAGNFTSDGYYVAGGGGGVKFTGKGTYEVAPDCTIAIVSAGSSDTVTGHQFGAIKDFGNSITTIRTDPGLTITVNYTRIAP